MVSEAMWMCQEPAGRDFYCWQCSFSNQFAIPGEKPAIAQTRMITVGLRLTISGPESARCLETYIALVTTRSKLVRR